jgi:ribose transport system substrate-binding protein
VVATTAAGPPAPARAPSSGIVAEAQTQLDRLYKGTYELPSPDGPKPTPGKKVWVIAVGQAALSSVYATQGFVQAAKEVGWEAKVVDGKFDPSVWQAGIRQAIAAKADGIWVYSFDCESAKAALVEAKRANIPVALTAGEDCKGTSPVTHVDGYNAPYDNGIIGTGPGSFTDWSRSFGAATAWWLVAKSEGKAQVIQFIENDLLTTTLIGEGAKEVLEKCPDCKILDAVKFAGTEFGPPLQQKAQQAILKNPQANAIHANYDTPVTGGIAAAVRESGRKFLLTGGEGFPANVKLVRQGLQNSGLGYDAGWEGWAGVDDLIRIFAGEKPRPSNGIGVIVWDEEHNLPPSGSSFKIEDDYRAAFRKAWKLGG